MGESAVLFADVDDLDGDVVTITWHCAYGFLLDSVGKTVMWTAPYDIGDYSINVVAEDQNGASTHDYITMEVRLNN